MSARFRFAKLEGLKNDFVVSDERASSTDAPALSPADVRALCDRHEGVGADGVLTILPATSPGALARMHLTNADGSVAEMCGNGLRCVAAYLAQHGALAFNQRATIDTGAGLRGVHVEAPVDGTYVVDVEMGPARFSVPGHIPELFDAPFAAEGRKFRASAVSMGNPHLVLVAPGPVDAEAVAAIGRVLEHDARFPGRTNVEVAWSTADNTIDVVVWERGVGLTQACGTGACAVAAVFARAGEAAAGRPVDVRLPGGVLKVLVPHEAAASVRMTGPARLVFTGEITR